MFNIRVYGVFERNGFLLVSEEKIKGETILKFPGGGVEFGEGTLEALKREFREELGLDVSVIQHLYTTDFFVRSFLDPNDQVISIYYQVDMPSVPDDEQPNIGSLEKGQLLKWYNWKVRGTSGFPLPIDKEFIQRMLDEEVLLKSASAFN